MEAQLGLLAGVAGDSGRVTVQVLPFTAGAGPVPPCRKPAASTSGPLRAWPALPRPAGSRTMRYEQGERSVPTATIPVPDRALQVPLSAPTGNSIPRWSQSHP